MTTELIKRARAVQSTCAQYVAGSDLIRDMADALEVMQRELDAAKKFSTSEDEQQVEELAFLRHELAARDLVIKQKDEALRDCESMFDPEFGSSQLNRRLTVSDIRKALSLQPTTAALDAYVAEKVKIISQERDAFRDLSMGEKGDAYQAIQEQLADQAEALKLAKDAMADVIPHLAANHMWDEAARLQEAIAAINALEK